MDSVQRRMPCKAGVPAHAQLTFVVAAVGGLVLAALVENAGTLQSPELCACRVSARICTR